MAPLLRIVEFALIAAAGAYVSFVLYTRPMDVKHAEGGSTAAGTPHQAAQQRGVRSAASGGGADTGQPVVAVVGGGLAGMAAVIEASKAGARVFLLEKQARVGGNSAKATSGINGAQTPAQAAKGIQDSWQDFFDDTLKSGGGRSDSSLAEVVTSSSADAVAWLQGFDLNLTALSHCGGHKVGRTHRIPATPDGRPVPVGFTTMRQVSKAAEGQQGVTFITNAKVEELLQDAAGAVSGVRYTDGGTGEAKELQADAVILTTGGYAYDRSPGSLLWEHAPDKIHLATTSGEQATGDGVRLALRAGARLVDMDQIQVHPTGLVDPKDPSNLTKFLGPESMRGLGGILVDGQGRRFVNELATRVVVTQAIFEHGADLEAPAPTNADERGAAPGGTKPLPPKVAYLLMNRETADQFGMGTLNFYKGKGLVQECANASDVAQKLGMLSNQALRETLDSYAKSAQAGRDEFGKTAFPVLRISADETIYTAIVTPAIHYTMGGVKIDSQARALRQSRVGADSLEPIPGLYAAGEVSGGVHGANRLAGNSLLECVVMGRIAGQQASAAKQPLDRAEELSGEL